MEKEKKFTIDEAHRFFGVEFNNAIFTLAEKKELSALEKEEIIQTSHAAVLHWQKFSKSSMVNSQRGYYMLAKAYVVAGEKENALKYAKLCFKITKEFSEELLDFDFGYAYEMMARTSAMNNNKEDFDNFYKKMKNQEAQIKDPKDLEYFLIDVNGGNWFGFL